MKFSPLSALKETDLQIDQRATITGKLMTAAFKTLFGWLNPYLDSINKLANKGITFTDNVQCEVINGAFTHGTPQLVRLKTLARANGAIILGCDGQLAVSVSVAMVQQTAVGPLASITVWFDDPTAASVKCGLLLVPEGQQTGSPPSFLRVRSGNGSPETVVSAPVGSLYLRRDGGAATTLYVKESGTAATGWIGK